MKKIFVFLLFVLHATLAFSQNTSNKIEGIWLNAKENAHIQIFERSGLFYGKVIWLSEEVKNHKKVQEKNIKPDSLIGDEIITKLRYEDGEWIDGRVYSIIGSQSAECSIKVSDEGDKLIIKLKKGWFSRTKTWTRL